MDSQSVRPPKQGDPRLRCAQTCQGSQAAHPRRYPWVAPRRSSHSGHCAGREMVRSNSSNPFATGVPGYATSGPIRPMRAN